MTIRAGQILSRTCRLAGNKNGALGAETGSPDVRAGPHWGSITKVNALPLCPLFRSESPLLNFRGGVQNHPAL